jgi:hypothetical protein
MWFSSFVFFDKHSISHGFCRFNSLEQLGGFWEQLGGRLMPVYSPITLFYGGKCAKIITGHEKYDVYRD